METTTTIKKPMTLIFGLLGCLILSACSKPSDTKSTTSEQQEASTNPEVQVSNTDHTLTHPASQQLIKIIEGHQLKLIHQAQELNDQVIAFAKAPSKEGVGNDTQN